MIWNWILDKQPEEGRTIIIIHQPDPCEYSGTFGKHYTMGMKKACDFSDFDELIAEYKKIGFSLPDYWWIYAEDFPFPDQL